MISKKSESKNIPKEIVLIDSNGVNKVNSNDTVNDSKNGENAEITRLNERYLLFYKLYVENKFTEIKINEERTDSASDANVNKPFTETYEKG